MTAQDLLRARAIHLKAISELRRNPPGHVYAYQRLQTLGNAEDIARHQAAIAELDGELERRRRKGPTT